VINRCIRPVGGPWYQPEPTERGGNGRSGRKNLRIVREGEAAAWRTWGRSVKGNRRTGGDGQTGKHALGDGSPYSEKGFGGRPWKGRKKVGN